MRYKLPRINCGLRPLSVSAFTILEIMVSIAVLAIILVITASLIDNSSRVIRHSNASIDAFQSSQAVFESMTGEIGQATLNTYWDYYDSSKTPYRTSPLVVSGSFIPAYYGRYSDLHFICGQASSLLTSLPNGTTQTTSQAVFFTAPRGLVASGTYQKLSGLLSACGYFVAFGSDEATRPSILQSTPIYRWRLMELQSPAESLTVFNSNSGRDWFTAPVAAGQARPIADNIIALIIWPRLSSQDDPNGTALTTDYSYDSRTTAAWSGSIQPVQAAQLPPVVQIAMVAIDETSAKRLAQGSTPPQAISDILNGLFQGSVTQYATDMQTLESRLNQRRIDYHIFHTSISLKESKWSE